MSDSQDLLNKKILLVDDEEDIVELIKYHLVNEGYHVETASNGIDAVKKAKLFFPDLILLDVMMPGKDGIETCMDIREISELKNVLIAFLTARSEDYSQIAGFDAGADDYIPKPIKPRVLVSRVKALLRRQNTTENTESQEFESRIKIDREQYLIISDGKEMTLPKKEFELLALLLSKPGKVFTRESIMDSVWGNEVIVGDRTIDVHIRKLRERLGNDCIKTIKGVGYKFETN
jgi:two-component system, OmpR family, alkaline phosphatase synthesis response regulator PhoP